MNEIEKAQQEITEAREKLTSAEARLSALSKPEKEYRAGEWVPRYGAEYYYVMSDGEIGCFKFKSDVHDQPYTKTGNLYPTEAIAEAAKAHADWWREFDMSDEGGNWIIYHEKNVGCVTKLGRPWCVYDMPRFKTKENAGAAIERLGGEQNVIDMLTRGRVFRFKWGGQ